VDKELVVRRYLYTPTTTEGQKGKVTVQLVEHLVGSNVVARITPLGSVRADNTEYETNLLALNSDLSLTGEWKESKFAHHRKVRAVLGKDYE
jgi:hypothetical protein